MTTLKLDKQGLIPAIITNINNGKVIMLGYMNAESINKTIETREVWFYSRSRSEIWHKGATSGNYFNVESMSIDCDNDTIHIEVHPTGPGCHTGNDTCFFNKIDKPLTFEPVKKDSKVIDKLFKIIESRKNSNLDKSYTVDLFNAGIKKISQKVVEEAGETAIAAVSQDKKEFINESVDLLYHLLVLTSALDIDLNDIWDELENRSK